MRLETSWVCFGLKKLKVLIEEGVHQFLPENERIWTLNLIFKMEGVV